jgi:protein TonB
MGVVLLMHVGIIYGLAYGLSRANVEVIPPPISADLLDEEVDKDEPPPPPPPPDFKPPPPDYVPPPEIYVETPAAATTAIQVVTDKKAPPPPPPAPKAERVVVLPKSIKYTQPDYPSASRRLGEEGSVVLELMVGEDGRVSDAQVVTTSGFPRLDEAALKEALRRWKFAPGTDDGKPRAMRHRVKVTFRLEEAH